MPYAHKGLASGLKLDSYLTTVCFSSHLSLVQIYTIAVYITAIVLEADAKFGRCLKGLVSKAVKVAAQTVKMISIDLVQKLFMLLCIRTS